MIDLDSIKFLREISALPGIPGYEAGVNGYVKEAFGAICDDVYIDCMENVIARIGSGGPRVMVSAHQDEIGLMVHSIEKDGSVRFTSVGGVDPRILPGMEVKIHGEKGICYGVIGAKPPHLLSSEERSKNYRMEDLYIDIGYDPDETQRMVRPGDMIVMCAELVELKNGRLAGKTMDDRASIAAELVMAEALKRLNTPAEVYAVASTQEEIGAKGALAAAYALKPDFAIAIDVCHGEGPGTGKYEAHPIDKPVVSIGPAIDKKLLGRLRKTLADWHIEYNIEADPNDTGTDLDEIRYAGEGVPGVLISIPLRYMHTTVETLDSKVIESCGRLMALFIDDIAREWGEWKWY